MSDDSKALRRDWLVIGLATCAGAVLRFWNLNRLGLDHFDEGIYAIAGLWITNPKGLPGLDPSVIAYAPPGYPTLVGLSYLLFGVRDTAAILISIVAGIATIPVVGWLGRRTFGCGAGAAAAWLCALSGPHVVFSRMALTDSLALLTFLIAIGLGMRWLERPGILRAVVFGLAVGVAQNVKYNGFLSGGIVGVAGVVGLFHVKRSATGESSHVASWLRIAASYLLALAVASLCYWPWFQFVEAHGGYADLLRHQRSYWSGPAAWFANWNLQLGMQLALSGELVRTLTWLAAAWAVAWLSCGFVARAVGRPESRDRRAKLRFRIGLVVGGLLFGLVPNLAWFVGLGMCGWLLASRYAASRVVGSLWLVMSVLTPMYHPYARLWLPLHAVSWFSMAGLIRWSGAFSAASSAGEADTPVTRPYRRYAIIAVALLCCGLAIKQRGRVFIDSAGWLPPSRPFPTVEPGTPIPGMGSYPSLLQPTDYLGKNFDAISAEVPTGTRALVRPAVVFYAGLRGIQLRRADTVEALVEGLKPGERLLIDGAQVNDSTGARQLYSTLLQAGVGRDVARARYVLPPATLLDFNPEAARGTEQLANGTKMLWVTEAE